MCAPKICVGMDIKHYGLGVLIFGLSIACPLEIVPEWYLIIFLVHYNYREC